MSVRYSSLVLLCVNLVPLAGVLWLGWDVLGVLLLYWAESVIVGLVNVLRMATCESRGVLGDMLPIAHMDRTERLRYYSLPGVPSGAVKLFLIPFFIAHYGMFCLGHLAAVIGLFAPDGLGRNLADSLEDLWRPEYWFAVAAIAASHLFSYFVNFLGNDEFRRVNVMSLMRRPYGRIVVMHLTVIAGAWILVRFGEPLGVLVVLMGAKAWIDLRRHRQERDAFAHEDTS